MTKKKWTPEEKNRFSEMCLAGASNKELADAFDVTLAAVQHRRSMWNLTKEKCAAMKTETKISSMKEEITQLRDAIKKLSEHITDMEEYMKHNNLYRLFHAYSPIYRANIHKESDNVDND